MSIVDPDTTNLGSESAAGVEPDRIIGAMTKNSREKVGVMLRTYRGCQFVDIREISTWPVLTCRRNGVTYSLDSLPETIDDLRRLYDCDCHGSGQMGFGNVRRQDDAQRRWVDFKTSELLMLIALLQRAHSAAAELGWCARLPEP